MAGETDEAAEKSLSLLKNQNEPTDTLLSECALACKRALRKEDLQAVLKGMSPDTLAIYRQRANWSAPWFQVGIDTRPEGNASRTSANQGS